MELVVVDGRGNMMDYESPPAKRLTHIPLLQKDGKRNILGNEHETASQDGVHYYLRLLPPYETDKPITG